MKTLSCKDLGGSCDEPITGNTFEELGQNSKAHVMAMVGAGDQGHIDAIERMRNATPEQQQVMFAEFQAKFEQALQS